MPIVDLSLDADNDLIGEWLVAILTEGKGEHSGFPLNWPGWSTSTVTVSDSEIVYCCVSKC